MREAIGLDIAKRRLLERFAKLLPATIAVET